MMNFWIEDKPGNIMSILLFVVTDLLLTLFGWAFLGLLTNGWPKGPLSKICHTYPTMMKLGTIIPYLKKIQKYMNHVTYVLSSADINIFSLEISKICYFKKCRYRLHFNISLLILLTFCWIFKDCFNKHGSNFHYVSKND